MCRRLNAGSGLIVPVTQGLRVCVRTVPSLKGLAAIFHFTQHSASPPQFAQRRRELGPPVSAPCWAKLFRAYGAGVSSFPLHRRKMNSVLTRLLRPGLTA
jgi:hypothetical protein